MSIKSLLFSFQGRIGRKHFWIWNAIYYGSVMGASIGVGVLFPAYASIILVVLLSGLLIPDLAITAKRWHDRNKSNWYLLLNIPLILGRVFVPASVAGTQTSSTTMQALVSIVALVCGAWIFIECGLLKGDDEANRYGKPSK
ncbi:DUF805 domain-containing protein [Vibrio sp. SCSIO 43136]|uniref:DUF805 domain-containing protein n=1 Tax=Vibrio sp. SCSIO 43136 TaxID=2819101 RepID=UPI0020764D35|nr:DUF805 domain-containing protein [Vibrio sp. SCSIO 43136]USD65468.1 DUF805 domain-containing protein [Vibrio sp. SCSIO 43136]